MRAIVNSGAFNAANLKKAGYEENPIEDGSLHHFDLISIDITKLTQAAVKESGVKPN